MTDKTIYPDEAPARGVRRTQGSGPWGLDIWGRVPHFSVPCIAQDLSPWLSRSLPGVGAQWGLQCGWQQLCPPEFGAEMGLLRNVNGILAKERQVA